MRKLLGSIQPGKHMPEPVPPIQRTGARLILRELSASSALRHPQNGSQLLGTRRGTDAQKCYSILIEIHVDVGTGALAETAQGDALILLPQQSKVPPGSSQRKAPVLTRECTEKDSTTAQRNIPCTYVSHAVTTTEKSTHRCIYLRDLLWTRHILSSTENAMHWDLRAYNAKSAYTL